MARIYFEIPESFSSEDENLDVLSINIYESDSKLGTFSLIDTVDFNPGKDYVETLNEDSLYSWFKLSYVDSESVESTQSDPILGEDIYEYIDRIALSLGDLQRDDPATQAFLDEEYITKIRAACKRYRGSESLVSLRDYELEMIIILVRSSCCYDLAYDNAKFTKIKLPDGIEINKGERVDHYLQIARTLESQYNSSVNELRNDEQSGGSKEQSMEVIDVTRRKYFNRGSFRSPRV